MEFRWLMHEWVETRHYERLWLSVPVMLFALAGAGFVMALAYTKPAATRAYYSEVAARALATRDFPTARVACNRLLLSWPESHAQHLFGLAQSVAGLGQEQDGYAIMKLVAPIEKPGYSPAHLYIARQLLMQTNVTMPMVQQAEQHLRHALRLEPASAEAHLRLGQIAYTRRNWDAAKKHLQVAAATRPETAILLASVAKAQNDDIGVRHWADRAVEHFRGEAEKARPENPRDRLAWATALDIADRYAEAIAILEAGRTKSGSQDYEPAMAATYAHWAAQVAKADPHNVSLRFKLIQQGLECNPHNLALVELLLPLTRLTGAEAKTAQATLALMLAEGGASPLLHLIVGNDAFQNGDTQQARQHFKLAFELGPNLPAVANKMALMLATGKDPDLPRALAISQPIVEKYPNEPDVRNTRGTILAKLGRWEEAVKDLEFALPKLRVKGPTHASLALAYRNLGLRDLADEHERLAHDSAAPAATGR